MAENGSRDRLQIPFFERLGDHTILTREDERHLAHLSKVGPVSPVVTFEVNNTDPAKVDVVERKAFRGRRPTRYAARLKQPRNGEKVRGARIHFGIEMLGRFDDFKPRGMEIVIVSSERQDEARILIPCSHHPRWGWYAQWDSTTVPDGKYEVAVHASEALAQRAVDFLMSHNYRLVFKIALKFLWSGMALEDLFSEGVIGLQKGIRDFDPNRGFRLNTFATWWVRQRISRAIQDQARTIRIPVHVWEVHKKVRKVLRKTSAQGEELDVTEIAEKTQIDRGKIERAMEAFAGTTTVPLEVPPTGENTEMDLLEVYEPHEPGWGDLQDPSEVLEDVDRDMIVYRLIRKLSPKEQLIVARRFGLAPPEFPELKRDDSQTLEEIGADLGVTRERIRQIEAKALNKLRKWALSQSDDLR